MKVQISHVQLGPADTGPGVEIPDAPPRVGLGAADNKKMQSVKDTDHDPIFQISFSSTPPHIFAH